MKQKKPGQGLISSFLCGLWYEIPLCCIFNYLYDNVLGRLPALTRWKTVAHKTKTHWKNIDFKKKNRYVPCNLCVNRDLEKDINCFYKSGANL